MRNLFSLALLLTAALLLAGCGGMTERVAPDQRLAYKQQREAPDNLEIPPDLTAATFDDALDIPMPGSGTATLSEFEGQRVRRQQVATAGEVLPEIKGVELRREGENRWLIVAAPPQQTWPRVIAFWREQGILLTEQDPVIGVMSTDWIENRAEISQDVLTNLLRRVADGLYATATRDQFRVRVEPGTTPNTTEIYLTHRGMAERLLRDTAGEGGRTVWEPSGSDPNKEAEMLRRLMVSLGVSEQGATRMIAGGASAPARSQLVTDGAGPELVVAEEFRRAWRVTGLALDRVGFAVEDQDYSSGLFLVRYDDPNREPTRDGWTSRLAFWRGKDSVPVAKYQIQLTGRDQETRVTVLDAAGNRETSSTAERILRLLQEEIR
ncbi:outer membrane protein assembly factor BamC [Thioalkalicoccus limnaeus]|uniref:Outer membrane protein assembly factor BamC n=1 Tax=Thioalkalicoccus limnaeus TaxID=120681 RepID=A0ABV4BHJ4_9GAMM